MLLNYNNIRMSPAIVDGVTAEAEQDFLADHPASGTDVRIKIGVNDTLCFMLQGKRARLRVPRLDMDGKLAALAHFSAALDEDLPLSWSSAAAFSAAAAPGATAVVFPAVSSDKGDGSSAEMARGDAIDSQTGAHCVAVHAAALPAAAAATAARSVGDGTHSPVRGDADAAHTPADAREQRLALCQHTPALTPGDALEHRLAPQAPHGGGGGG